MLNSTLKTTLAALVLLSPLAATEASAKVKSMKFHFVQSAYEDYPTYEMKFQNGSWKWVNKGKAFRPRMKVYSKHNNIKESNTGATFTLEGTLIGKVRPLPKKYEKLVTLDIGSNILKKKEAHAISACKTYGGSKKVVKDMGLIGSFKISTNHQVGGGSASAVMKTKVVCHAKSSSGGNTSSGPKLTQLTLYTIPKKPVCGHPVQLVAEFHSTGKGKVDFQLRRYDGAKQNATVVTTKVGNRYFSRWVKNYTFNQTTDRMYRIKTLSQTGQTPWVPVKVSC